MKNLTKQEEKHPLVLTLNPEISQWRTDQSIDPQFTQSLKEQGQLQSIVARWLPDGRLEIIYGHRRYKHLLKMGIKPEDMKIDIRDNVSDQNAALMAYAENNERKDMTALEEGRAYKTMMKLGLPQSMIAAKFNLSENFVHERLDLLKLPAKVQERMEKGDIELSYGKPINRLAPYGETAQISLAKAIVDGKKDRWGYGGIRSVNDANSWVDSFIDKIKRMEELVKKYGPCPHCQSKEIEGESYPQDQLTCKKCGYKWNKNTGEAYGLTELRKEVERLGLKLEIGDGKAKITTQDITDVIQRVTTEREALEEEDKRQTLRSVYTPSEILEPLVTSNNINIVEVEGEDIEIRFIQDSHMHFSARTHNYDSGEKSRINLHHTYSGTQREHITRIEKYLQTLKLPE